LTVLRPTKSKKGYEHTEVFYGEETVMEKYCILYIIDYIDDACIYYTRPSLALIFLIYF
jgi:hypothetical protein